MKTFILQIIICTFLFKVIRIIQKKQPFMQEILEIGMLVWLIILDFVGIKNLLNNFVEMSIYASLIQLVYTSTAIAFVAIFSQKVGELVRSMTTSQTSSSPSSPKKNNHPKNRHNFSFIIIILLVVIGLGLRLYNAGKYHPTTDEFYHLATAKSYLSGNSGITKINNQNDNLYTRANLVTKSVQLFIATFGDNLLVARLPGILLGTLTIIPIYFFASKADKKLALLSASLWAISPWAITTSRIIREYTYYALIIFGISLALFTIHKLILKAIEDQKRTDVVKYVSLIFAIMAISLLYAFRIDQQSTFQVVIFNIAAFVLYQLLSFLNRFGSKNFKKVIYKRIIPLALIILALVVIIGESYNITWRNFALPPAISEITYYWLLFIFNEKAASATILVLTSITFGISSLIYRAKYRKSQVSLLILCNVFVYSFVYLFIFKRRFQWKYFYYALPWFVITKAAGLQTFTQILGDKLLVLLPRLNEKAKSSIKPAITIIVLIATFNWYSMILAFTKKFEAEDPLNRTEYHEPIGRVLEKYEEQLSDSTIITTLPYSVFWYMEPVSDNIDVYHIVCDRVGDNIFDEDAGPDIPKLRKYTELIESSEKGFVIIDIRRNNWGQNLNFPLENISVGKSTVEYQETYAGYLIYKWYNPSN